MPVHDWTRVVAGTFHDFHGSWITHLKESLNGGLLPTGYYAMSEQHAGRAIGDVLTLQSSHTQSADRSDAGGGVAVAAPPRVGRKIVASPNAAYRQLRRTIAVRHVSGHRIVAMIEIISPGNKDRETNVRDFAEKAQAALRAGIHLLVVDLFPPGPNDPHGMHGAIWEVFDPEDYLPPPDQPLTLVSYVADRLPEAYLESLRVGDILPDMPLFLTRDAHIDVPLEAAYQAAYRGFPAVWRTVLEATG